MPCEHYKDALVEVAASGAAPQGELRAHLDECASCRAGFGGEQTLFAAIDSGIHAVANTEVPLSLLPRIRARVAGAAPLGSSWFANGPLWACAAVAVVALFAARGVVHKSAENQPPASKASSPPSVQAAQLPLVVVPLKGAVAHVSQIRALQNRVVSLSMTEVHVPQNQEVLVAQYAQQWQRHKPATLVAEDADWTTLTPSKPAPIQINPLDVKLLKEVESL